MRSCLAPSRTRETFGETVHDGFVHPGDDGYGACRVLHGTGELIRRRKYDIRFRAHHRCGGLGHPLKMPIHRREFETQIVAKDKTSCAKLLEYRAPDRDLRRGFGG